MEDVSLLLNALFLNERPKFWWQEGEGRVLETDQRLGQANAQYIWWI